MKSQTVSARVTPQEMRELDHLAEEFGLDRSAMTRSLLRRGLREVAMEAALKSYAKEQVTLSRAAELAGVSTWDFLHNLEKCGGELHYGVEEFEEDLNAQP